MIDQGSLKKANLWLFQHPYVSSGECRLESITLRLSVYHLPTSLLSGIMAIQIIDLTHAHTWG